MCDSCVGGWVLNETDATCEAPQCDEGSLIFTGEECGCPAGFFPNDTNFCELCDSACATCEEAGTCTSCIGGFFLDGDLEDNPTGVACSSCPSLCVECDSSETCNRCAYGFMLTETGDVSTCEPLGLGVSAVVIYIDISFFEFLIECPPGCATCQNATTCDSCAPTFFFDPEISLCYPCPADCVECFSEEGVVTCDSCALGFRLGEFGMCEPCDSSICMSCDIEAQTCTKCLPGAVAIEGECVLCESGCSACLDGECLECMPGFALSEGACFQCLGTCAECQIESLENCTSCY